MKPTQIAAQLYTVRDLCQTSTQTIETLKKIRGLGYAAVEVGGGPIAPPELTRIVRDLDLNICAVHGDLRYVLDEPAKVVAVAETLNCDLVIYTAPVGFDLNRMDEVDRLIEKLSSAGAIYRKSGKTFCYHHHSLEFVRHQGKTVLEHILDRIEPGNLALELDTYWIQHGGGVPQEWCQRLTGRLPIVHIKDYGCIGGVPTTMEIGNGNLHWPSIINFAQQSGCRWFVVEQDTCPGDPLDSLKISYDYLNSQYVAA